MSTEQQQHPQQQQLRPVLEGVNSQDKTPKKLPKGVVLGPDGKPCRSCTSFASWAALRKEQNPAAAAAASTTSSSTAAKAGAGAAVSSHLELPEGCPPDVEHLGRSSWTLLHSLTATYPERPSQTQQQQTKSFISLFSTMYPCSHCAEDFQQWMREPGNTPRLSNRDEFGRWMCEAHNAVNLKLGKERFDCSKWDERWRTGPPNGRCG